jgi:hypothetical protein
MKKWRWCITDTPRDWGATRQETGDADTLDEAMEIIAKTAKKMIGSGEPVAGWFGA